ncbi:MAG: hypothetical protein LBE56_13945 [Tannerella sp.]|jgi:hypothetical protein|nr:hypothetical protein [Tannerella sp.]
MKKYVDLALLDRMDFLIRLGATGSLKEFASKMKMSPTTLYEYIVFFSEVLLVPIRFNKYRNTLEYEDEPDFHLGFEKDLKQQ